MSAETITITYVHPFTEAELKALWTAALLTPNGEAMAAFRRRFAEQVELARKSEDPAVIATVLGNMSHAVAIIWAARQAAEGAAS